MIQNSNSLRSLLVTLSTHVFKARVNSEAPEELPGSSFILSATANSVSPNEHQPGKHTRLVKVLVNYLKQHEWT